jgi:crotonobetainyl-CoA:carnitine CoA-transferase CaiB-like acyl-CoA transferase
MSVTGEADGPPLKVGVAMADLATGMYATVSILAALRHAERTGEGQQIDISLLDTQIAMLANQASSYLVGGVVPGRMGNRHPTVVPYTTFRSYRWHSDHRDRQRWPVPRLLHRDGRA